MNGIITTKDAADKLDITIVRVHQLVRELGLTPESIGKAYIFSADDLLKMSQRQNKRSKTKKEKAA